MPTARSGLGAASINGIFYAIGGYNGGDTAVVEAYNPATGSWSAAAPLNARNFGYGDAGRYGGSAATLNAKAYMMGGWTINPPLPSGDVSIYDPAQNLWSAGPTLAAATGLNGVSSQYSACSEAASGGGMIFLANFCNGYNGWANNLRILMNNAWVVGPNPPNPHGTGAAAYLNGKFYLAGGTDAAGHPTAALDVYDPQTNTWRTAAGLPVPLTGMAGDVINGKWYVVGGNDSTSAVNTLYIYDPLLDSWSLGPQALTARSGAAAAAINGKLYVAGGINASGNLNTLEVFDPAPNPPPPTVTLLSPTSGSSVAGFVTLTSTATGNVGSIAYTLDGSGYLDSANITPPYVVYWDTTKVLNGVHTLTAGGWDKNTGQWLTQSPAVTVTVNNPVPAPIIPVPAPGPEPGPNTLTVLSPAYGASISSTVVLTAAATGNVGCVVYTLEGSGYLNGCLLTPPYTFSWDTTAVAPGTHTVTAGGWDKTTGAFLIGSAPVIVTVGPVAPPPPTATILTPVSSASVSGFVTLISTATGNVGSIAYTLDGSGYLDSAIITPPYVVYWDTTKVPNGVHTLIAVAWEKNTGKWLTQSPAITVTVNNPVPAPVIPVPAPGPEPGPTTVTVLSPAYGASISSTVVLTAAATGNVGCVAYTLDGSGYLDGCLMTPPYSFSWDATAVAPGTHTVTAGGWDKTTGAFLIGSAPVIVTVGKPAPPATPAPLVITSPAGGENWLLGSTQTITWTGGAPAWPMLIQVIDVAKWQVAKTLAVNAPNSGAFPWVVDMPPASYQIYLQGDRGQPDSAWIYSGRSFAVSGPSTAAPESPSTVTILTPANNASAAGFVTLTATATGNVGSIAYTLDGSGYLDSAIITPPFVFYWDTTKIPNGVHTLSAGGWDKNTGQWLTQSPAITVTINNPVPAPVIPVPAPGPEPGPNTITVLSPGYGTSISSTVVLTAAVTGNVGCVTYTLDGSGYLDACLLTPPYAFSWDTTAVAPGTHTVTAGAWDKTTRAFLVESAPVIVTVGQPPAPAKPAPASGLTATSVTGSLIVLNWTPSPTIGVTGYHLYSDAGTGTIDYGSPLAVLGSTQTTFTVGPLASTGIYNFALRADLGSSEETMGVLASATLARTLAAARAAIKTPDAGKHVAGNSVTVSAQLIAGGYDQVSQVAFEYRASATTSWLLIPAANANHRNPAQSAPFFMQWDVTGLAPGSYDLRAVAKNASGGPDPAPGAITIVVDPVQPDIDENVVGGEDQKRQRINTDVPTVIEASGHQADGPLAQIMVPSGCLSGSTVTATVVANPPIPASPPPGFSAVGSSLQIDLDSGQHMLLAEQRARITLSYPNTVVDPENLRIYSLDPTTGRWSRDFDSTVNMASRTVSGLTPHFSVFALFSGSALATDLSSVRVYPVPYRPDGANPDEGKHFSAGDPTSGIIFDNLAAGTSIKIYTITGRKVVELSNSNGGGAVQWDARNGDGRDVASGGYFAVISAPSQSSVVKKLAIIR